MDELPDSVLKVRQFWKNTCYRIADHIFSLDDIEHGILRGESTDKDTDVGLRELPHGGC